MSIALNIRVGGLLLMAYFGLYTLTNLYIKRKEFKDSGLNIIALLGKSITLGIVSFFSWFDILSLFTFCAYN